ncbi:MAG: dUTP diphosphatase [Actinomycetales bacterium]|nr:dUTP diphosphatase [Actinomycetales bacterium]
MGSQALERNVTVLIAAVGVRDGGEPPLPRVAHPGDGAVDLVAATAVELAPGERAAVGTGLAIALPAGFAGLVLPRSGRALREGVTLINSPGLIDAGYRGEITVALVNLDPRHTVSIAVGDRIAQLLIVEVPAISWLAVARLPGSQRGADGFGSTGV